MKNEKYMRNKTILIYLILLTSFNSFSEVKTERNYIPQVGDVLFQSLKFSPVVFAIEGTTKSPYSHCGILTKKEGSWLVCEAIGPVKLTPIKTWIKQGRLKKYDVYRFKEKYSTKLPELIQEVKKYMGKPYDIMYDFNDKKIYCSELIFKGFKSVYKEDLGQVVELGELDWKPYEPIIRKIDPTLPLKRKMITPKHLSEAEQLKEVYKSIDPSTYLGIKN